MADGHVDATRDLRTAHLPAIVHASGHLHFAYFLHRDVETAADLSAIASLCGDIRSAGDLCAAHSAFHHVHTARDLRPGEDAVIVDDEGRQARADPTRQDGWDWTDRTAGKLEVFGPACRSVAQGRRALRMLTTRSRCHP